MPVAYSAFTSGWKGTFNKEVVFRQRNGKTVISAYPDMSNRVLTDKQKRVNKMMKEANEYAGIILLDERSRNEAQVRLNVIRNKLYTALIREYYKNNYRPDQEEAVKPVLSREESVKNHDFMKYLLENTEKSIDEIHKLTGTPLNEIFPFQDIYRKEKPIIYPNPNEETKA